MSEKEVSDDNAERHFACRRTVIDSGISESGVRLRCLDIAWNMRERAVDCDRTGSGNMHYGEFHVPITSDTLRAFAEKVEEAALLGLDVVKGKVEK